MKGEADDAELGEVEATRKPAHQPEEDDWKYAELFRDQLLSRMSAERLLRLTLDLESRGITAEEPQTGIERALLMNMARSQPAQQGQTTMSEHDRRLLDFWASD